MADEIKIMSRLGVDYSQAIKSAEQLAASLSTVDKQLKQLQFEYSLTVGQLNKSFQGLQTGKVILDQFGRPLKQIPELAQQTANEIQKIAQKSATDAETLAKNTTKRAETFWQRRVGWFVAGAAFYGGLNALRDTIKTIGDVEMGMTQIARVIEDTNFSFAGMREELFKLGKEYGMTFDKVQDIALRWAQAGYNMQDTLELTRDSLLALNTAELDAEQATSGLIAIMAQWGLTADQLLPVIDKINKVADDFAITSEDLVAGLTRSGGAAKVLGLTLEQTIAILTVMREATGRTGKEIGNALNSILSFMQRPKSIEAFEKEGIKVWADEAKTTFRNVIDIFNELAQRWPQMSQATQDMFVDAAEQAGLYTEEIAELTGTMKEFTDVQQRDLSQAAAGIYRRNYLLALLQNWSKIDQVLLSQEQALGYSIKENQRTMETYQKKVEQLKAAYQELQVAIGESGLLDNLKGVVDVAREGVEWLNKADPAIKDFIVNLGMIAGAIATINTLLRVMGGVEIIKMGAALSAQIAAATEGVTGLKAALAGLGVFIKANLPLLAVTGALTVLGTVLTEIRQQEQKMREQAATAAQLLQRYEQIQERLSGLAEGTKQYTDALQELQSVKLDIFAQFPEVMKDGTVDVEKLREIATAFDDIGKSVKQGVSVIEQYNERVNSLTQEVNTLERNKNLLQELAQKHRELSRALKEEKEGSEEAGQKKEALAQIEQGIISVIGQEGFERLKAAGFTVEAVNKEIEAINKKIQAKNQEQKAIVENEKAMTKTMIQETITRMNAALLEAQAMAERAQALKQSWMTNDSNLLNMTQFVESSKAEQQSQYYLNKAKEYQQLITKLQSHLNDLTQTQGKASRAAGAGAGETGKLTDAIRRYIETVMQAVDAIEELNTRRQQEIDLLEARINYFGREGTSIESQLAALRDRTKLIELAKEQQKGLHEENIRLTEANKKLEEQMKKVNRTTDEGRQAFQELSNQIKENNQRIAQNSVEWWKWQEVVSSGISRVEMLREVREAELNSLKSQLQYYTRENATKEDLNRADDLRVQILMKLSEKYVDLNNQIQERTRQQQQLQEALKSGVISEALYNEKLKEVLVSSNDLTSELFNVRKEMNQLTSEAAKSNVFEMVTKPLDHFARMGILSVEEQIKALQDLRRNRELDMEQQWEIDERLFEHYKDLLNQQKKDIEEAYQERLRLLEETTNAQIEEIQRLIDALDQEATNEEREEAERQHNQKIAELLKERYYHELRTGIEHQREIERINQEIAEENRRWELQQNEWAREDKRKEYEKQIEDIREQAEKQRQEWEEAWERLEADFSDHNINMLAAAAAYDDDWYKDAKRKAQKWFEGFKEGLPSDLVGNYLSSLVGEAEDYLEDIRERETTKYISSEGSSSSGSSKSSTVDEQYYRDKALLSLKKLAEEAYASGNRSLAEQYHEQANAIRESGSTLDPNNTKSAKQLEQEMLQKYGKAHEGAYVVESGAAVLLKGERVLSPQLTVSFDRLANALLNKNVLFTDNLDRAVNRIVAALEKSRGPQVDKLLNIERYEPADATDIQILGRELVRSLNLLNSARGR
ncbi:MAG: phage tail tape measure protein [Thermacetogeniaceae bacterium]